ncbi:MULTISPECIES: ribose-5-phosphate isomerase RpiA [Bacillaceae]|uniref:Ribose-5-phosphate isomerase A n=1 Tax=Metabacillus sediminis TaxID=3117746 RepID=A0ABZ2NBK8_9BACI|nr:ribose-5-phosphate isomerase RpiA [Bacillus sp. SJS]KZZ82620.1 ribose 5-phosphate isomerase A [Bacillus sp. SJS]
MNEKKQAGEYAAGFIKDGMTIGLGTGSTVYYALAKIGEFIEQGMTLKGVATSTATARIANSMHIPLIDLNDTEKIDLTIDGADEIDPKFNGIKGGGGALLREKLVANASDKIIWVAGHTKLVQKLGKFPLPVEVLSFGSNHTGRLLEKEHLHPILRKTKTGETFYTDSGNVIYDLHLDEIAEPGKLAERLKQFTGVVEHGLFLAHPNVVITGTGGSVVIRENKK